MFFLSKESRIRFAFVFFTRCVWRRKPAPLFQSIRSRCDPLAQVFPRFAPSTYSNLLRVLIGMLDVTIFYFSSFVFCFAQSRCLGVIFALVFIHCKSVWHLMVLRYHSNSVLSSLRRGTTSVFALSGQF